MDKKHSSMPLSAAQEMWKTWTLVSKQYHKYLTREFDYTHFGNTYRVLAGAVRLTRSFKVCQSTLLENWMRLREIHLDRETRGMAKPLIKLCGSNNGMRAVVWSQLSPGADASNTCAGSETGGVIFSHPDLVAERQVKYMSFMCSYFKPRVVGCTEPAGMKVLIFDREPTPDLPYPTFDTQLQRGAYLGDPEFCEALLMLAGKERSPVTAAAITCLAQTIGRQTFSRLCETAQQKLAAAGDDNSAKRFASIFSTVEVELFGLTISEESAVSAGATTNGSCSLQ